MRLGAISLPAAYLYTALFQTRAAPSQNSKHAIQHFFKIIFELWIFLLVFMDNLPGNPSKKSISDGQTDQKGYPHPSRMVRVS